MTAIYVVAASIGGTILVIQLVLTLIGLSGDGMGVDVDHDFDADHDFDVGHGLDGHGDGGGDAHVETDLHGETGGHGHLGHHLSSSWVFAMISFRTVVAALAFFGLAGLAAESGGAATPVALVIALAAGAAAMYAVYWMLKTMKSLKADGTARIERAVGRHGTVYVTVPAKESGAGKVQLNVQGRTMEYLALTSGHALPPGTKVVVSEVIASDTVEVEPVLEAEE